LKPFYYILCIIAVLSAGCQNKGTTPIPTDKAKGFSIDQQNDSCILTIYSPWEEGIVMSQVLCVPSSKYERIVCTSATHIGFISELGFLDKVVGVTSPERIYSITDADRKRITNIGDDIQLNLEALLLCHPDVIIMSTYAQGDERAKQIESLGIPVIYCHEWMECSPLARAEWIRMFGAILGCRTKADSIYNAVSKAYSTYRQSTPNVSKQIMSGMSWRGTWYVPAGGTFMGRLFKDAGAQYKYQNNPSTSSIPLNMEQALQDFEQADVWVGCEANTLEELESIDQKHLWFKAYQNKQVYNFRKRSTPTGANDFWESGVVHPERLLHDLQNILKGDTSELYYTTRLR
jgi:iron complex transport system substrate-binding protein